MRNQTAPLASFMPYRISITANAISDLIAGEYQARFGLKVPEWRVLAVLGDVSSSTQRDLVQAVRMDKVAVNRACKALANRGLLSRTPNDQDGRSHHLALTREGRKIYIDIMPLALEMERKVLAGLSLRDAEKLDSILTRLLESVEELIEQRSGPAAR